MEVSTMAEHVTIALDCQIMLVCHTHLTASDYR